MVRSPERLKGARLALIGEGPADEELARGACFVGPSGVELEKTLARAGLNRREVAIENAFLCAKPKGATGMQEARAVEACRGHVQDFLEEVKPWAVVALGGRALRSIAPGFVGSAWGDGLMRHRGSLWRREEVEAANGASGSLVAIPGSVKFVMATLHPAAIIHREKLEGVAAMGLRLVPALDVRRVMEAKGDLQRHHTRVVRGMLLTLAPFAFDLETDEKRKPTLIGVQALDGGPVWSAPWEEAEGWARQAFASSVLKVGHNIGGFDIPVLRDVGIEVAEPFDDTMTLAGVCEPDMPRGLYFQAALYDGHRRPFWKELHGARKPHEIRAQTALRAAWMRTGLLDEVVLTEWDWLVAYNAMDVDGCRRVWEAQTQRCRKEGWT